MTFKHYLFIFNRTAKFVAFQILRNVYAAIQAVVWRWNGTYGKLSDAKKADGYNSCVQVLDVWLFFSFDQMVLTSRKNYICTHNRFESPRYVFENDHVTLITIDDDYAIFGEAREKGMQLWKLDFSGFMKLAQLEYCNKLLLVPMEHFHRMSEELGDPNGDIIFLFNVGRCGSTLMTQIFESTDRCVSLSEPGPLFHILDKQLNSTEHECLPGLCKDLMRWICRPCTEIDSPVIFFVKVPPSCTSILPIVYGAFPQSKYLFMYRNPADVAQSFCKVLLELPFIFLMNAVAKISVAFRRKMLMMYDLQQLLQGSDAVWDDFILGIVGFVKVCQIYLEFRRNCLPIVAFRYEDLVSDPTHTISQIFKFCGLPEHLVNRSLNGLASDAQRNSPLSVRNLRKHTIPPFTSQSRQFANNLLKNFNLPSMDDDFLLEGTIAHRG